jgi:hypothetical protein
MPEFVPSYYTSRRLLSIALLNLLPIVSWFWSLRNKRIIIIIIIDSDSMSGSLKEKIGRVYQNELYRVQTKKKKYLVQRMGPFSDHRASLGPIPQSVAIDLPRPVEY